MGMTDETLIEYVQKGLVQIEQYNRNEEVQVRDVLNCLGLLSYRDICSLVDARQEHVAYALARLEAKHLVCRSRMGYKREGGDVWELRLDCYFDPDPLGAPRSPPKAQPTPSILPDGDRGLKPILVPFSPTLAEGANRELELAFPSPPTV